MVLALHLTAADEMNELLKPYRSEWRRREKQSKFMAQCIRAARREDFFQLGDRQLWILVAALQRAAERHQPLRIAITALTHHAIDQLLRRVVKRVSRAGLEAPVWKLGRDGEGVKTLRSIQDLQAHTQLIVGGTGHGLNRHFSDRPPFDLIAVDEASQLLLSQAWLALICGRRPYRMILVGDQHQLGPVIQGPGKERGGRP
ncbi:MAG: AAA domain-containing protein [Myxococcota bacterium]